MLAETSRQIVIGPDATASALLFQVAPGVTGRQHGCMPWVDRADAADAAHRERGRAGILPPCRATCTTVPAEVRPSTAGARSGSERMAGG